MRSKEQSKNKMVSAESETHQNKKLIGIKGWLLFFVVMLCISILFSAGNLIKYIFILTAFTSRQGELSDNLISMNSLMWFEAIMNVIAIAGGVWLLVLIMKHKKFAIRLAIIYFLTNALLVIADSVWAYSIFSSVNGITYEGAEMNAIVAGTVITVIVTIFWLPYILISKRVKATLIN